ncbi:MULTISPECIES: DegV family protein [Anaerolinea]|uniref:DegV family protein n=1 Tax=Anaerolinea TaxID=233189 RepID=UPI0026316682|nr:DegV family protein [Anaerolinea thermophila]
MLRIVTDGATDMPASWVEEYGINVIPLRISVGEKLITPGKGFSFEDFYRLIRETRIFPKTSLPSPGEVVEFYRQIAQQGDTILSLHLSSKLSGTYNTIRAAADELKNEFRIFVFDSNAGSAAVGFMCREARLMERAGYSIQDILKRMEHIRNNLVVIFTLDNLEFAKLSGRINALQSALASLLNVKPVIILKEGLLEMAERIRTRHRALEHILNEVRTRMGNTPVNVAIVHAADLPTAQQLKESIMQMLNVKEAIITDLSIPVASHLGPGTVGIVAYPATEE